MAQLVSSDQGLNPDLSDSLPGSGSQQVASTIPVPHPLGMEPLEPLCKASAAGKILLLLGELKELPGEGQGCHLPTHPSCASAAYMITILR